MNVSRGIVCLFIFGLALLLANSSEAQSRGRRRSNGRSAAMIKAQRAAVIKAAQTQYAQGEAVLSVAMSNGSGAQSRLAAVISQMQSSVGELHDAQSQEVDLKKDLADIEADILREQSNDSPYAAAQGQLQDARSRLAELESKLLHSADYLAKKATLARSAEGPAAVAVFRQETLEADPDYTPLHLRIEELSTQIGKIKRELFAQDTEWKTTHDNMLEARKDATEASSDVYKSAPNRADPLRDIKDAKQAASAARMVMAQAEAVLKQYNAPTKPTTKTASTKK